MADNEHTDIGSATSQAIGVADVSTEGSIDNADVMLTHIQNTASRRNGSGVFYHVNDRPPLLIAILFGFQHFLTFIGSGIGIPLLLAGKLCMSQDPVAVSQLISTAFFVEGIVTFMQVTFGVRLPVVQGASAAFLAPTFAILQAHGECPEVIVLNATMEVRATYTEAWQHRIREIQGAIMVSSCLQIIIGFTGIIGFLLKYIGPVTIAPVVALVGIGIIGPAADRSSKHWGFAFVTIALIILFSQYLSSVGLPCITYRGGKCRTAGTIHIFKMLPVALATLLVWFASFLCTAIGGVFPDSPSNYGYEARTDLKANAIREASWFRVPYPGQWGLPYVTIAGVLGMFSAVIASVIESIGDYYATARMAGARPPPAHAVNRGITIEGLGCLLAGALGTANGTTSFSQNAGLIGLTKVGSRFVIQMCALIMILCGMIGKVPAFFSSIPIPIVGGMLCVLFGTILGVGLSNLQYVDLGSPRNVFIVGFSLFMGILVPYWAGDNKDLIKTGVAELDQVITVLLTTGMFIGGLFAFVLDNTVPGTIEERGIIAFGQAKINGQGEQEELSPMEIYDLPMGMSYLRKWKWTSWLPVSPTFKPRENIQVCRGLCRTTSNGDGVSNN